MVAACRPQATQAPFDPNDPQALAARLKEHLREHPQDDEARRDLAHLQWMYLQNPLEAMVGLDELARRGDSVARLSRMIAARAYADADTVTTLAYAAVTDLAATAVDDPKWRLRATEAEHAARWLSDVHGDRSGDDDRFAEMFDEIAVDRLPFAVAQPLLSLRASIARRRGEDYRALYRAQGCAQRWSAGPVEGSRGMVELSRAEPGQPLGDPGGAAVVPLACVMRLWNPEPSPGIRRMVSHVDSPGGTVLLDLGAQEPSRFYLDGRLLHATDGIDRYAPHRVTLAVELAAGSHALEVHTSIPSDRAWVMVRAWSPGRGALASAAEPNGTAGTPWGGKSQRRRAPWPKALPGTEGRLYAPLRAYLAVDDALAEGDSDRAERNTKALRSADSFAAGQLALARFERADPSRGQAVSLSREVEALQRALEIDPKLDAARLRELKISRDRGEQAEVEEFLADRGNGHLLGLQGELLRFSVFMAQGNEHRAERALSRAAKINPKSCEVLMAQRSLARDRVDVRAEDEAVTALARCAGSLALRARLAEARGRWDEAAALLQQILDRSPDDLAARERLARVESLRGDVSAARKQLATTLTYNPFRVGSHLALADLSLTAGDRAGARAELRQALDKVPQSNALWHAAGDLGLADDLMNWRTDGTAVLASYRESGATYEGAPQVLVLDRSVARVYKNGGQRQIVHIMAHLLSKESLDEYGELEIPGGAELLTLRTIKPDGRTIEPEIVPGKDGVSLRHLEIGDFVEYEFIAEQGPAGAVPGYIDVSTFRFQSPNIPYHRSELLVVHPESIELRHDERNAPPTLATRRVTVGDATLVENHWQANEVPRLGVEPGARHWLDELPSVHVYTVLDLPRYLDGLAAQIRGSQRRNPALRRKVAALTRRADTPLDTVRTLWSWVVENVEDSGDLSVPASATFAGRTGSRLMLLRAMLREAGIEAELWLARDAFGPQPQPDGHPLVDQYEAGMLAVRLPGREAPLMVMTVSKVLPLGYLAPSYRETGAVRIQLEAHEEPSGPVTVPPAPADLLDQRHYEIDFDLQRSGAGTAEGTIVLQGMEALLWRQALRQIDRDRIEEVFTQAELGWLPGASLESLTIENEDALAQPLTLRFAASSSTMAIAQGGALVLRATPMPLNQAAMFAGLPSRTTGLSMPYAPTLSARLTYRVDGATLREVPKPAAISSEYGRFERTVDGGAGNVWTTIEVRSTLRTGTLPPERYPGLAQFARDVEQATQEVLRIE